MLFDPVKDRIIGDQLELGERDIMGLPVGDHLSQHPLSQEWLGVRHTALLGDDPHIQGDDPVAYYQH